MPVGELGTIVIVILVFTLIGGFFAATETALVSLRDSQVSRLAETAGRRGQQLQQLMREPNRFLAAAQVGVTLAGFLSAGFGASQIVPILSPRLTDLGFPAGASETFTFVLVTLMIAYVSLVAGELVPKRLALQRAEAFALFVAGFVDRIASLFRPFIWLLSKSTDVLVRVFGGDPTVGRESISGEELRGMVASHAELSDEERELIDDVFEAGERQLREVMVPRTEVEFLDAETPVFRAARTVSGQPHSRYPVIRDSADDVVGFVHVRDILDPAVVDRSIRLGDLARDVILLPGSKQVIPALSEMRRTGNHLAIVVDEYGGTAGIVTLEDLVEELIGDIRDEYDVEEPEARRTLTGEVDVDGLLNLEDFAEEIGLELPDGPYETVAGYVVTALGDLPAIGSAVEYDGFQISVTELDGRRISRLRVRKLPEPETGSGEDAPAPHQA